MLVLINHGRVPRRYVLVAIFIISNIYRIFKIYIIIFMNIIFMKDVANHHLNADIFLELYLGFITGSFCASLKWVTDISSRSRIIYSTAAVFIVIICTYWTSNKSQRYFILFWNNFVCCIRCHPSIRFGIIYLAATLFTST